MTEIGVGRGENPAGQREIIWKLKTKQTMNPGVWELKREVLCNSSQLMSLEPVLRPTGEAKGKGGCEVGRTQTLSLGSEAQHSVFRMRSGRTKICLSKSQGPLPAEMMRQSRRGASSSFKNSVSFLGLPRPQPVFLWPPKPIRVAVRLPGF